jgi:hypothetical protein
MSNPDQPSIAGAAALRRKAVAHQAGGTHTFAVSSTVGLGKVNGAPAVTTIPVPRIHYLAQRIHLLGEPVSEHSSELIGCPISRSLTT